MDEGLPRPPSDPGSLDHLRQEALRKVKREERAAPVTVYGAPPIPVYGGPPPRRGRSWWRWVLLAIIGLAAAILAWMLTHPSPINPAPVYGGPPPTPPHPAGLLLALQRIARKLS